MLSVYRPAEEVETIPPTEAILPSPTRPALDRLTRPPVLAGLTDQANRGAEKYWGVCMACHGDRGQGLTDEWRGVYEQDSDCWSSGCHGSDHPPQTFELPITLTIPAVAGTGRLGRFANAQELYDYILANMPWWKPGSISPEDAWGLTAHLLRLNGTWPPRLVLSARNASAVSVHYLAARPTNNAAASAILSGLLLLASLALILQHAHERRTVPAGPRTGRPSFYHHLHPPTIPAAQARFRHTLGAGGLSVFLALVLVLTGALEMFYYTPAPDQAAVSIETITYLVPYGSLVRGLHFWAAQALVVTMSLHLLRVVLTGAYARRRRLNFMIGLGLLVLILLLDFTGYVLRWDEGIRWALVVGTNLLKSIPWIGDGLYLFVVGGPEPGASALIRFYGWHIFGLTLGLVILGGWHLFRVRRDGGIAAPPRDFEPRITRPELVKREAIVMVAGLGILLLLAALFPAPLEAPMLDLQTGSRAVAESPGEAPWFFLWVQRLLGLGDPFLFGVLMPFLVLLVLSLIPYVLPAPEESEVGTWFPRGNRLAQWIVILLITVILLLTILSLLP